MRYFCAHVVSGTSFAGGLVLGSGTWIFAGLPGGRRALRAVLRRRRAGLAVAVRARAAAGGGTAPRRDRLARQGAVLAAAVRDRSEQAGGGAGRGEGGSPRGAGGAFAARRGRAAEAAAGGGGRGCAQAEHDRLAAHGGRDPANPYRGARGGACEASRESGGACQGAVRAQERAPGAGGVGPSARPTGRRRRPWPHTPRPGLEKRAEVRNPAADERVCSDCGKPYVANGSDTSELIEVSVKAHTRVIERPRWRRGCDCAAAPPEVSAPPVARLFANTPYGTSVWARLFLRPPPLPLEQRPPVRFPGCRRGRPASLREGRTGSKLPNRGRDHPQVLCRNRHAYQNNACRTPLPALRHRTRGDEPQQRSHQKITREPNAYMPSSLAVFGGWNHSGGNVDSWATCAAADSATKVATLASVLVGISLTGSRTPL